jgi:hypothetical protein
MQRPQMQWPYRPLRHVGSVMAAAVLGSIVALAAVNPATASSIQINPASIVQNAVQPSLSAVQSEIRAFRDRVQRNQEANTSRPAVRRSVRRGH